MTKKKPAIKDAKKFWLLYHKDMAGFTQSFYHYSQGSGLKTNFFKRREGEFLNFIKSGGETLLAEIPKKEIEKILKKNLIGLQKVEWQKDDKGVLQKVLGYFDILKLETIRLKNLRVFRFKEQAKRKPRDYVINPIIQNEDTEYCVVIQK